MSENWPKKKPTIYPKNLHVPVSYPVRVDGEWSGRRVYGDGTHPRLIERKKFRAGYWVEDSADDTDNCEAFVITCKDLYNEDQLVVDATSRAIKNMLIDGRRWTVSEMLAGRLV